MHNIVVGRSAFDHQHPEFWYNELRSLRPFCELRGTLLIRVIQILVLGCVGWGFGGVVIAG